MFRQVLKITNSLTAQMAPKMTFRPICFFQDNRDAKRVETNVHTWQHNLPKANSYHTDTLETQEIESRILKVMSNFEQVNLKTLKFDTTFKKLGLDSLNQVAVLTSIEHEFTVVFPDGIFEGFDNLQQVASYIQKNINVI